MYFFSKVEHPGQAIEPEGLPMTGDGWITVAILGLTFGLLIGTKLPPAAVFVGALTVAMTFGLAPAGDLLKGFSNQGVLTVGALYMVAAGMYSTGAVTMLGEKLIGQPKSVVGAQVKILPPVAVGSAFLNNTPLVAMFIPVIRDLARTCRLTTSRLYIPLSFASILGGTCTLIGTSTNLVVAGLVMDMLRRADEGGPVMREIGMFDLSWVGVPLAVAGIVFMIVTSKWLLPNRPGAGKGLVATRRYGAEFQLPGNSSLSGRTLGSLGWDQSDELEVTAIYRANGEKIQPETKVRLETGDVVCFSSLLDGLSMLWETPGLEPFKKLGPLESQRYQHRLVEVVMSPQAPGLGNKIADLPLPDSPYQANIVALSRGGRPLPGRLNDDVVMAGDNVVIEVDEAFFYVNANEELFSITKRVAGGRIKRWEKATAALIITAGMVLAAALGWMSMLNAALLASGAMVLTGCLSLRAAGRSVEVTTLVVIACAIGMESAVTNTGLSDLVANFLSGLGGGNPQLALVAVFLGCIFMDTLITNVASAAFMFPIAMSMAAAMGLNGMPFAITVMVGASCSFISPMGYQTNLMVYEPGGYKFTDFARMGVPLTLLVGVITIWLTPSCVPF
jgi:di/tricarboxylate transporter